MLDKRRTFLEVDLMKNIKRTVLIALSIVTLAIGILGIANVGFFDSNVGLELIEIVMGIGGLIIAVR
jgi:hypothetical protein